ncbi:hypothetical protein KZZ52_59960 [Dactylosporangium sp. AC04546]|uniref:hypothetical protein n=1 Tax=Dactylosporangium sp. AC04546 TaxID=2862460 RepID=UPI001EDFC6E5|nr:hypothetical protein [Dactylosporangium sp. AC04546]WVK83852.1 hypothetical protein KZZ52_59960 [Dactylosporangium sp. AC04546]
MAASAAAIAAASLTLGAGPVSAAPTTPTVEFSGGSVLSLLVCKSEPSAGTVSVPAESRVNFVNRLGQNATLKVDGKAVSSVQPNQAVPVVFRTGPAVEVAMTFSCGVGVVEQFKPVSVGVTNPPPAPVTKQSATTGPAGSGGGTVTNPTGKASPTGRSSRGNGQRSTGEQDTAGVTGTEPVDPSLLGPDATAAPAVGAEPSTPTEDRVTVEQPVAASGPARNAPTGLLALVATVCAVGVGIAAIRAIIAQRSSRASFA